MFFQENKEKSVELILWRNAMFYLLFQFENDHKWRNKHFRSL